jgi:hypothetical protein
VSHNAIGLYGIATLAYGSLFILFEGELVGSEFSFPQVF